jgi:hypothetical protein
MTGDGLLVEFGSVVALGFASEVARIAERSTTAPTDSRKITGDEN